MTASEFTIRNKSTRPIFTLRPATLKLLLSADPEAASMVLAKYSKAYKQTTGKGISIDHEQHLMFLSQFGANENGTWTSPFSKLPMPWYLVDRCFWDGYLDGNFKGFREELETAEAFYLLMAGKLPQET